jgi:ABC-type polysaccharide/polyol phosphate export permease
MAFVNTRHRPALLQPWRSLANLLLEPARTAYAARYLVQVLVWQDFVARYRGSAAGLGWAVLLPLALVAIYMVVFSQLIPNSDALYGSPAGFALYLLSGNVVWITANEAIMRSTTLVQEHRDLLQRSHFRFEILPLAVVLTATIGHLFGLMTFVVAAIILQGARMSVWGILVPAVVGVQVLVLWCLTCLTTPVAVYFRDFRLAITPLMLIWFFLTPVFYPLDRLPSAIKTMVAANPITVIVSADRSILLQAAPPDIGQLLLLAVVAWVGLAIGLCLFRRLQPGFAEQL